MRIDGVRTALRERIARGATLEELDTIVRMTRGLTERQRAVLMGEAWRYDPRRATMRQVEAARALLGRARPLVSAPAGQARRFTRAATPAGRARARTARRD